MAARDQMFTLRTAPRGGARQVHIRYNRAARILTTSILCAFSKLRFPGSRDLVRLSLIIADNGRGRMAPPYSSPELPQRVPQLWFSRLCLGKSRIAGCARQGLSPARPRPGARVVVGKSGNIKLCRQLCRELVAIRSEQRQSSRQSSR